MKKNTRFRISLIALLGILGLGYYAYTTNRAPASSTTGNPAALGKTAAAPGGFEVAVEAAMVEATDYADEASAVGSLKSRESVVLRPETAGRISKINFKDGAIVTKGTPLIMLDAAIQEAELAQAKANLGLAKSNNQRNQELVSKNFLSQQALENSAANLKVQEAAVQLAAAKVAKTRILAPFDGMLGLRNVSVGDYVKEGQDLINIEDIATLSVDFRLPENYLGRLTQGQAVEVVSDALPGQSFSAVLDAIDPLIDQGGRSISARAKLDNSSGKLRPGVFLRVRLIFGERKGVLLIPEQAVIPGAVPKVFRIVEGKAVMTKVALGSRRNAQVEVVEGLASGDVVVTAGHLKLREGAAVKPIGLGSVQPAIKSESKESNPAAANAK